MLCHVPSIGSCSQFCLILHPHRVAVPFPPTFALPRRNSFVQIHGGTTLLKAINLTAHQKRPKNYLNWVVGWSYGTNQPFQTHRFPMKLKTMVGPQEEARVDIRIYSQGFYFNNQKKQNMTKHGEIWLATNCWYVVTHVSQKWDWSNNKIHRYNILVTSILDFHWSLILDQIICTQ